MVNGLESLDAKGLAIVGMAQSNGDGFNDLVAKTDSILEDHLSASMSAELHPIGGGAPHLTTVDVPPPMRFQHDPGTGLRWWVWRETRATTPPVVEYNEET